ncbi:MULTISPECIES: chalcone isomerase family protein [Desulfococcus]|uniref:Chalcone isomerase domain-containing protein n=1 Tax=Desulfococcus multivorans DSM 2059 TaxID=1121405 RepID=S7U5R3_DESML|nr:chalcone isomerase family protein [Desulfococcus multivorans]EPR44841.1 hypothetical protein dsmv_3767 [Desulfococcus multivorans DSM 2059]SJZ52254.1 Chalcone isomerase-like [Desulfococcus multivorans DSM 2059]
MLKRCIMIALAVLTVVLPSCSAETVGGVAVPDTLTAGNVPLVLNGVGLRQRFFMKIYAGALYLEKKSSDARKIIAAEAPMAIRMHFIHDGVPSRKLIEAWNEGFENSTRGDTAALASQIEKFNACFTEAARAGDVYDIIYSPGQGIRVYKKNQLRGAIQGTAFKKALFGIWLGEKPADQNLKEDMLGK